MVTILYLEDDEALAFVTKRALERKNFVVHHFLSVDQLKISITTLVYTHVLLDLKIGNETSINLIGDIKKMRNVPVVILTGYGTIRTAVQAMKMGAVNFLSKPCGIDEIIQALFEESKEESVAQTTSGNLLKLSLKAIEHETIQRALDENEGNISAAARQLKMHRRTLQRKLQKKHTDS